MPSCTVDLDLDEELEARLRGLATSRGASLQQVLKEAARSYVEREEAFLRERDEDDARYREYLRTGKAVDHDEVSAWLDSIGTDNPLPPPHRRG
jgi:predicted transcriptional regulator